MMRRTLCWASLLLLALSALGAYPPVLSRTATETLIVQQAQLEPAPRAPGASGSPVNLLTIPTALHPRIYTSPRGGKIAFATPRGTAQAVVSNGTEGKAYPAVITELLFTGAETLVYAARAWEKVVVVRDTEESAPYDGLKLLMVASDRPNAAVRESDWTDGDPNAWPIFTRLMTTISNGYLDYSYNSGPFLFSGKGGHVAWVARVNGKQVAVLDGKEGKPYDLIGALTFSPNGERFAYTAKEGSTWRVVIDGVEQKAYAQIPCLYTPACRQLQFSRDSRHLAYPARKGGVDVLVMDGREVCDEDPVFVKEFEKDPSWPYMWQGTIATVIMLDKHGRRVPPPEKYPDKRLTLYRANHTLWVFSAKVGKKEALVENDRELARYDEILSLDATPDGKGYYYIARIGKQKRLVLRGVTGRWYDDIAAVIYSPDKAHFAYVGSSGTTQVVVVDGKEGMPHADVREHTLAFTPDSRHVHYEVAGKPGGTILVVDGQKSRMYGGIGQKLSSPDGKLFLYTAQDGERRLINVNGSEGQSYPEILGAVHLDGPDRFHYFARTLDGIVRVDEQVTLGQ